MARRSRGFRRMSSPGQSGCPVRPVPPRTAMSRPVDWQSDWQEDLHLGEGDGPSADRQEAARTAEHGHSRAVSIAPRRAQVVDRHDPDRQRPVVSCAAPAETSGSCVAEPTRSLGALPVKSRRLLRLSMSSSTSWTTTASASSGPSDGYIRQEGPKVVQQDASPARKPRLRLSAVQAPGRQHKRCRQAVVRIALPPCLSQQDR